MSGECEVQLQIFGLPEWTSFSLTLDTLLSLFYIVRRRSVAGRCDCSNRKYFGGRSDVISYASDRRKISQPSVAITARARASSKRGSLARNIIQRAYRGKSDGARGNGLG